MNSLKNAHKPANTDMRKDIKNSYASLKIVFDLKLNDEIRNFIEATKLSLRHMLDVLREDRVELEQVLAAAFRSLALEETFPATATSLCTVFPILLALDPIKAQNRIERQLKGRSLERPKNASLSTTSHYTSASSSSAPAF